MRGIYNTAGLHVSSHRYIICMFNFRKSIRWTGLDENSLTVQIWRINRPCSEVLHTTKHIIHGNFFSFGVFAFVLHHYTFVSTPMRWWQQHWASSSCRLRASLCLLHGRYVQILLSYQTHTCRVSRRHTTNKWDPWQCVTQFSDLHISASSTSDWKQNIAATAHHPFLRELGQCWGVPTVPPCHWHREPKPFFCGSCSMHALSLQSYRSVVELRTSFAACDK